MLSLPSRHCATAITLTVSALWLRQIECSNIQLDLHLRFDFIFTCAQAPCSINTECWIMMWFHELSSTIQSLTVGRPRRALPGAHRSGLLAIISKSTIARARPTVLRMIILDFPSMPVWRLASQRASQRKSICHWFYEAEVARVARRRHRCSGVPG